MMRDCPTNSLKGKGKNGKGDDGKGGKGGKGEGKEQHPQHPNKGKGKGINGECFHCGKWGHRAAECRSREANAVEEEQVQTIEEVAVGGVWMVGAVNVEKVKVKGKAKSITDIQNRFSIFGESGEEHNAEICAVEIAHTLTRESGLDFNVADVKKPLASAVRVVRAGNRVVMDEEGSYIENKQTGERMEVRVESDTFVFDVEFQNGEQGTITLDSGAGCNVWPHGKLREVPMRPKNPALRMTAANGTEIQNCGRKLIQFRGVDVSRTTRASAMTLGFRRQAA
jgi:hypothetical protein